MADVETGKLSLEEAKQRLLNPPPEGHRHRFLEENAVWLVLAAVILGFFTGTPKRIVGLAGLAMRVLTSPTLQKAVLPLILNAARRSRR